MSSKKGHQRDHDLRHKTMQGIVFASVELDVMKQITLHSVKQGRHRVNVCASSRSKILYTLNLAGAILTLIVLMSHKEYTDVTVMSKLVK